MYVTHRLTHAGHRPPLYRSKKGKDRHADWMYDILTYNILIVIGLNNFSVEMMIF